MFLRKADGGFYESHTSCIQGMNKNGGKMYHKIAASLRQLRLTNGTQKLDFNYWIRAHTMLIGGRPTPHIVDKATPFCAASFLQNRTTKEIWYNIQDMWCLVYLGFPDYLVIFQGFFAYAKKNERSRYGCLANETNCADMNCETSDKESLQDTLLRWAIGL